jgi:NAD(P)-dependent dehydrogenase (short-subunit alcohol dehydrogenase family)
MRLEGKVAVVVGAGQTRGETIGNGRAAAILFAREGAKVLAVDRDLVSAEETVAMIADAGGEATPFEADITRASDCAALAAAAFDTYGGIHVLHINVGIGAGDADPIRLSEEVWDRIQTVNLKGHFLTCKHALPIMRKSGGGSVIFISSVAAVCSVGMLAYETSKAGVNALSHSVAMGNAKYGIRSNVIMPGLMDTPMAIEGNAQALGLSREEVRARRDKMVPLGQKMGTAWDVAYAALFFASDESKFVTGTVLPVDGGQIARIG